MTADEVLELLLPLAIKYVPELVDEIKAAVAGTHPDPAAVKAKLEAALAARDAAEAALDRDLAADDAKVDAEIAADLAAGK